MSASRIDDMKYLQEYILDSYPMEGKIISSFPPYLLMGLGAAKQLYPSLRVGGGYYYSSTGSRSNYTDYSGHITSEMTASSHRLGLNAAYMITGGDLLELNLAGRIEFNYTMINISTLVQIYNLSDLNTSIYHSFSAGGAAGLEFLVHVGNFSIGPEAGYEVNLPGYLMEREDKTELLDPEDRDRHLTSDWTGWYAQLKVLFWL